MATFNFDSMDNIINTSTPSLKAINKMFCGQRNSAGLWVADDSMETCKWKKECIDTCESNCTEHYIGTKEHIIQAQFDNISGRGIINPRICVLRRTKLIKITTDKGRVCGYWVEGDGTIKNENGSRKYACARRYLIVFLDEQNKPLHSIPLQFTAKGTFQINFDKELMSFRNDMRIAYGKSMNRQIGQMKDLWYSMCVFKPVFESKMVGKAPLLSQACAVKSYEIPTECNWLQLCVGRDQEVKEFICTLYMESEEWIKKIDKSEKRNTEMQELIDTDF